MKKNSFLRLFLLPVILSAFLSCSKTDDFTLESAKDYFVLTPGKYITYQMDSLVFVNFQMDPEIHSYQSRHVVNSVVKDNEGRDSYIIYRYIRKADGTGPWDANGSYMITPLADRVEVIENNLRFDKVHMPIREGFAWRGNKYLPSNPYSPFGYAFALDNDIQRWEKNYSGVNETLVLGTQTINNVISVFEIDEVNYPDTITVAGNQAIIPDLPNNSNGVWVKGSGTDTIEVIMPSNDKWKEITLFNATNQFLLLDTIGIPAGYNRSYEHVDGSWFYGRNKETGVVEDTVNLNGIGYATRYLSKEKYAKNIGLVQREYELWETQTNSTGNTYYIGFGIKLQMIDHN